MNSLVWVALITVMVVVVALTGRTPKGGKPVARTGLMKAARTVLVVGIIVCAAMGLWGAMQR